MPFTTPPTLNVATEGELTAPTMDDSPLRDVLENANHLWRYFRPPLLNVGYLTTPNLTADPLYRIPVAPSADGLTYRFRHLLRIGSVNGSMTVIVREYPSAGVVHNSGAIATTANTEYDYAHTGTIASSTTYLEVEYQHGVNPYTPDSVIVYPDPGAAPSAGIKASGFIPFDDGLLSAAGPPITTEHLNRCRESAVALLLDRKQCVFSCVQDARAAPFAAPSAGFTSDTVPMLIGKARCVLPGQVDPTITVYAIAAVTAGATADRIMVRQVGGNSVYLAATDTIQTGNLTLDLDGTPTASAEIEVYAIATVGNVCRLRSCVGVWRPGG